MKVGHHVKAPTLSKVRVERMWSGPFSTTNSPAQGTSTANVIGIQMFVVPACAGNATNAAAIPAMRHKASHCRPCLSIAASFD